MIVIKLDFLVIISIYYNYEYIIKVQISKNTFKTECLK